MINNNKKLHSIKVTYYYEFDWDVPTEYRIFKTMKELDKWDLRNPECMVDRVKMRYYKEKATIEDIQVNKPKVKKYPKEVMRHGAGEVGVEVEVRTFPKNTTKKQMQAWLFDRGLETEYFGSSYAGSMYAMVVVRRKNKVYIIQKYDM